jgi:hypothetical protein
MDPLSMYRYLELEICLIIHYVILLWDICQVPEHALKVHADVLFLSSDWCFNSSRHIEMGPLSMYRHRKLEFILAIHNVNLLPA